LDSGDQILDCLLFRLVRDVLLAGKLCLDQPLQAGRWVLSEEALRVGGRVVETVAKVGVEVVLSKFETVAHAGALFVLALFRDVFESLSHKLIVVDGPQQLVLVLDEDLVLLSLHQRALFRIPPAQKVELYDLPLGLPVEVSLDGVVLGVVFSQSAPLAHERVMLLEAIN
jgi:hypothetical protein